MKNMPDFIVIGAGKSGTTALNRYLKQHPGIHMAPHKEPNFFAYESVDPDNAPADVALAHYRSSITEISEYQRQFTEAQEGQVKGEISNIYLYTPRAAQSIQRFVPQVKLVAILRQPADRLFSRYQHLVREEKAPTEGMTNVFDRKSIWWKRNDFVHEGFYYQHLKDYYERFPEENIRIYLYDDFLAKPAEILKDMFQFIGVDPEAEIDTNLKSNVSGHKKKNLVNHLVGGGGLLVKLSKKAMPGFHRKLKNNTFTTKQLQRIRNKNLVKDEFDPKLRTRITKEIYHQDIQMLQDLINRDLSRWY